MLRYLNRLGENCGWKRSTYQWFVYQCRSFVCYSDGIFRLAIFDDRRVNPSITSNHHFTLLTHHYEVINPFLIHYSPIIDPLLNPLPIHQWVDMNHHSSAIPCFCLVPRRSRSCSTSSRMLRACCHRLAFAHGGWWRSAWKPELVLFGHLHMGVSILIWLIDW